MNGNINYVQVATDIPTAILEILENVDYEKNTATDIKNAQTVILEFMGNMTKKTKDFDVIPRSTNISTKVIDGLNLVNWAAYSKVEMQNFCAGLDSNIRTFLAVLR